MPEFRCTNCSKLLRTPDESAGKKAKCPQCGTIVGLPTAADQPLQQDLPPGEASSDEVSQNPFAQPPNSTEENRHESINPYAAPTVSRPLASTPPKPADDGVRIGLPWERDGKSVRSFSATVKQVLLSPTERTT